MRKDSFNLPITLFFCFSGVAFSSASSVTLAALDDALNEELIVVSSRMEQARNTVGSAVSVVGRTRLDELVAVSAADVLRSMPGVAVSSAGGAGQTTTLRLRGEEGFRTLFLLDGIEISDPSAPQSLPIFDHVTPHSLSRIEILRGPQGLIYGADAGGVISARSREADDGLSGGISAITGRHGEQRFAGTLAAANEHLDISLSLEDFSSDGFSARELSADPLNEADGYDNTTFHVRFGAALSEVLRLELVARDTDAEAEFDGCFDASFSMTNNCLSDFSQQAFRAALQMEFSSGSHELAWELTDNRRDSLSDDLLSFGTEGEIERLEYLSRWKMGASSRLVLGLELQETAYKDNFGTDTEREQQAAFFEFQSELNDAWAINAGLRYEDNDDFGTHISYRVSSAYTMAISSGELKFRGSAGSGFRAPSLFEIYNNINFAGLADAGLKEEQSKGFDVGIDYLSANGLALELSLFYTELEDEILFDFSTFAYAQAEGKSSSQGLELSARAPLGKFLNVEFNYTYNDTETRDGRPRLRRPEHLGNVFLRMALMQDRLTLVAHARGSLNSEDIGGVELDNYGVLNLSAEYEFAPQFSVFAAVENALDKTYQEVLGFNSPRAVVRAGVNVGF